MNCSMIKEFLETNFSSVFHCYMVNDYLGIETPFEYPDRDVIQLFLHERNETLLLSDLGETMRFLGSYDLDINSYSKRRKILDDVVKSLNVNMLKGTLYVRLASIEDLSSAIFDLSQCVIRLCDLLYTVRGSGRAAFVEEVKDYLDFNKFKFEENYTVETDSDHRYEVDLAVETGSSLKLIELVNPPSRPSNKPNTDRLLRIWVDIEFFAPKFPKPSRITLLDDSTYSWRDNETGLLEKFSLLRRWSDKPTFLDTLRAAIA